jgi:hypothetical protein
LVRARTIDLHRRRFVRIDGRAPSDAKEVIRMRDQQEYESHPVHEPDHGSWTGYAAIKYTAIVIIVLAILAFLAWYVVPKLP